VWPPQRVGGGVIWRGGRYDKKRDGKRPVGSSTRRVPPCSARRSPSPPTGNDIVVVAVGWSAKSATSLKSGCSCVVWSRASVTCSTAWNKILGSSTRRWTDTTTSLGFCVSVPASPKFAFCRTHNERVPFLPRDALLARYMMWPGLCLLVRLCVTSPYCTNVVRHRITQTTPHNNPRNRVFWRQNHVVAIGQTISEIW